MIRFSLLMTKLTLAQTRPIDESACISCPRGGTPGRATVDSALTNVQKPDAEMRAII